MKRFLGLLFLSATFIYSVAQSKLPLSLGFDIPQDTARTKVWWFHGETVGTHEGITADLEAFRQQGVGGVVYYDQVHGNGEGASEVFSPEWWDELIFSAQEARRLGLSFETNCGNGYVAGGKWITPDRSMQSLACTEMVVEGGGNLKVLLPLPEKMPGGWHHDVDVVAIPYDSSLEETDTMPAGRMFTARSITYEVSAQGKARTSSMPVPATHFSLNPSLPAIDPKRFYGCGFIELPPVGELQASDDGVVYKKVCDIRPRYRNMGGIKQQTVAFPTVTAPFFRIVMADSSVSISKVRLSARAKVDAWQQKASLISEFIDAENTPHYTAEEMADFSKSINLTSLLSDDGTLHWDNAPKGRWLVLRFVSVSNGGHTKHGRKEALGLECDKLSVEGARMQWQCYVKPVIDSIRAHGGELQGICMDSHEAGPQNWTVGFEREFQKLRGYDMRPFLPVMAGFIVGSKEESVRFLHDLRRTISDLAAERYYGEMNRLCRSEGLTLTAQAIGGALCMAGDAIAVKKFIDKPQGEFWGYQTEGNYDIKDCSSAAHIYGKNIASGEAFTDVTYKHSLADIKNLADYAYCFGINELVVCAVAYQPWLDNRLNTANGRQYVLNRKNTLWPMSRPFWDYQARCSWMMRQGMPVADVCVYLGDEVPIRTLVHRLPDLPQGYGFDSFTTDALLHRMTVSVGRIALPGGISYKMMVLPPDGQLTAEARQRIDELRRMGAIVYDPQNDSRTVADALSDAGIRPDVDAPHAKHLYFAHRSRGDVEIYFLNNHGDEPFTDNVSFGAEASSAEVWNPLTGEKWPLAASLSEGRTTVALSMAPRESFFVILDKKAARKTAQEMEGLTLPLITAPWTVCFDTKMGGPDVPVTFKTLTDWTASDDPRIKHYSGTAICKSTFNLNMGVLMSRLKLRLPLINAAAEVIINGQTVGIVWCSPWTIDITEFVRQGTNHIQLNIANCLWNRLVGDASLPEADRIIRQTHQLAKASDALLPSGVNGAITITLF